MKATTADPPRAAPPHPPRDGRRAEPLGLRRFLGVPCGDIACRFTASGPRAAEARGDAGVHPRDAEDPPKMCAMLAAGAALSLGVMSLAVPRELEARRRARSRAAQEKGARGLDRRW